MTNLWNRFQLQTISIPRWDFSNCFYSHVSTRSHAINLNALNFDGASAMTCDVTCCIGKTRWRHFLDFHGFGLSCVAFGVNKSRECGNWSQLNVDTLSKHQRKWFFLSNPTLLIQQISHVSFWLHKNIFFYEVSFFSGASCITPL